MASKNNSDMSNWVGWVAFGGVMLYLASFFHLIAGFMALFTDTVYILGEEALWALDYTQWGWIHVIWGLVLMAAASSLLSGKGFGRTIAVLAAVVSILVNMLFIPIYPIWSVMIIVVNVLVIYAVIVHGGELKEPK